MSAQLRNGLRYLNATIFPLIINLLIKGVVELHAETRVCPTHTYRAPDTGKIERKGSLLCVFWYPSICRATLRLPGISNWGTIRKWLHQINASGCRVTTEERNFAPT
jgi:hypothetical protein